LADANANSKQMVNDMKKRLKEALDDKRDFEMEFLQLQKNFVGTRNKLKAAQESSTDPAELERLRTELERAKQAGS
jgi:tryptophan synthase beta subunit